MTKMNFRAGRQNMSSGLQNGSTGGAAAVAAADEILRGLFPAGAIIDPEKLEYSFATPYNGPPVELPLPRAPLALYIDGTANGDKPLKLHIPVAQPLTDPSAVGIEYAEAAAAEVHYLTDNGVQTSCPSEIEELIITSPSPQQFRRTPSFEGTVAVSSTLQYSEDLSEPQSGELPPTPRLDCRSSSRREQDNFPRKRGQCYRCLKGHRLTEKEICLVCGAKYCVNCVLIAMGSMPEGRKCEDCVGHPILETRRPYLGKPSRLLRRLLSSLEIQQCMKTERECAANQLQPEQVFVNGRRLVVEEMAVLLGCVKLKPGRYWYDKASGLWGKEGEKPDAVITPELKVGGPLQFNASNGSTQVFLNGREVTKSELKMLKTLGVQCTPPSYLVLYPDGRYGDEGQKEIKGNLWNKPALKLLQPFFSFPTPRTGNQQSKSDSGSSKVSPAYLDVKDPPKILLLGHEDSGRSTIFNQTKILQNEQFSPQEVQKYKEVIVDKVYQLLSILLEARVRFEEEDLRTSSSVGLPGAARSIYSLDEELIDVADRFLDDMSKGDLKRTLSGKSQYNLLKIWNDPAIRETYKRKDDIHLLPEIAEDLLNSVLQRDDYVPSEADILWAEVLGQGTGLAEVEFTLEDKDSICDSNDHQSDFRRYQLISIGGLAGNEFRKWLDMFEDVKVLVYCVAISDYDQTWTDSTGVVHNKLVFSRDLFFRIVRNPCFQDTPLVLLLNKFDKFEEKVTRGVPLTSCDWFSDYSPVGSSNSSQVQQAYMYVVHKYKRLLEGRRVYTLQLNALDRKAVSGALEYVQQILKCEEEKKAGMWNLQDESIYDTSSFMVQQQQQHHHHLENR